MCLLLDETIDAIKDKKDALKKYKMIPFLENFKRYKVQARICSRILNKRKRTKWKELCNSFSYKTIINDFMLLGYHVILI